MKKVILVFMLCCTGMIALGSDSGNDSDGSFLRQRSISLFSPNAEVVFSDDDDDTGFIASPSEATKCSGCAAKDNECSVFAHLCGDIANAKSATHRQKKRAEKYKKKYRHRKERSLTFKEKHKKQLLKCHSSQQELEDEKRMNRRMARRIYDLEMERRARRKFSEDDKETIYQLARETERRKESAQEDASIIYALSMKQQKDDMVIGHLNDMVLDKSDEVQHLNNRLNMMSWLVFQRDQELRDLRAQEAARHAAARQQYDEAGPTFY
jgi:hypothetical protein